jgi:hypothetical protein
VAAEFAAKIFGKGFVYEINPLNGIDVQNHLYDEFTEGRLRRILLDGLLSEKEVSIPHQIEPSNIKGAWEVRGSVESGRVEYLISGEFIPNPQYQTSTAVRLAQGAKVMGHAATAIGAGIDGYNLIQAYQNSQKSNNYQEFFKEGARIVGSWTAAIMML